MSWDKKRIKLTEEFMSIHSLLQRITLSKAKSNPDVVVRTIENALSKTSAFKKPNKNSNNSLYILKAFVDEMLCCSNTSLGLIWNQHTLCPTLKGHIHSGEEFYRILDQELIKKNPDKSIMLYSRLALDLGYKGKYFSIATPELEAYKHKINKVLVHEPRYFANAYNKLRNKYSTLSICILMFSLCLLFILVENCAFYKHSIALILGTSL